MWEIQLRAVSGLMGMRFFIPSYQRGYRWEKEHVLALLLDLSEFFCDQQTERYCLQPLVVKKRSSREGDQVDASDPPEYEVVDGQQRLTTLCLILQELGCDLAKIFHLRYERHEEMNLLLRHANEGEAPARAAGADFHHVSQAREVIRSYLAENPEHGLGGLSDSTGRQAVFIWYELGESEKAIPAFSRLNAGKIRLTGAELLRGLFLREDRLAEERRREIAAAWDRIERRLRDDEFWCFVAEPGYEPENRIELLLRQVALEHGWIRKAEENFFAAYTDELASDDGRERVWRELLKLSEILEEWYQDDRLFHLTGYLIWSGYKMSDLLSDWRGQMSKIAFLNLLKRKIWNSIFSGEKELEEQLRDIRYDNAPEKVRRILLCFNLATLLAERKGTVRFSFASFRSYSWDVEHVRASASRPPEGLKELRATLEVIRDYVKTDGIPLRWASLAERLANLEDLLEDELARLYEESVEALDGGEELDASDDLWNLALLDSGTNRGYGNSPFAVKRAWVLGLDQQAVYVLPCTRNVFTKSYTPAPLNLLGWSGQDAQGYLKAMVSTLADFFGKDDEQ